MSPPVFQPLSLAIVALTLDQAQGRDNMGPCWGTSEDKGREGLILGWETGQKAVNALTVA